MTLEPALPTPEDADSATLPAPAPVPSEPPTRRPTRDGLIKAGLIWLLVATFFWVGLSVGFEKGAAAQLEADASLNLAVPASLPPEFATYLQAWQVLQNNYVDPDSLEAKKLIYGSIEGLVTAVGDNGHTRFLTPAELAASHNSLSGEVVGIGAIMSDNASVPTVQSVIPGGPADKAGVRSGDAILAVDGKLTQDQDLDAVIGQIRGEAGTVVKLSVLHEGAAEPVDITITRERVEVPAVSWVMVPGTNVADIRLEEFSTGAAKDMARAIKAAQVAGAGAFILDLRSNPGGYVGEAVDVASLFLTSGNVFQQRDRAGVTTPVPVKTDAHLTDAPLVVLIDKGSASAAEIVSGALQDAKRATLIGQTTFGTGTVLNEFKLPDGSALLVGTLEWLTRDGREIWRHGIEPTITLPDDPAGKILTPADLADLSAAGLRESGDLALLRAVTELAK